MKAVLFDTNVILDVLLDRAPHADASAAAWESVERRNSEGFLAAHAVTTIHYLIERELGSVKARRLLAAVLHIFQVAAVDDAVLREALELGLADFEDAVTAVSARNAGCDFVISRDPKGFRGSPVRCLTPEAALSLLGE